MKILNIKYSFGLFIFASASILLPGQANNGFDLSNSLIDINEIYRGGPPRDGIPSLSHPEFLSVDDVDYLKDDDIVIGLVRGNTARAYPTRILIWHEIANDIIEGDPVAVVYCPLCGTAMVFDRNINGRVRDFGVSGLLYQSDVLMYDRETESLWSQLEMKSVSGPEAGTSLKWLSSEHMTWKTWKEKYPYGEVLSINTGFNRNYAANAYAEYFATDRTMFPVPHTRNELRNKALVIGIIINGTAKAYSVDSFNSNSSVHDRIGNQRINISYNELKKYPTVRDATGEDIPYVMSFWFAWQAFYPDTELWNP
ncbi:MAG: DUF3179 domain-containing protein [Spirochaetaceae bacterium]|nr:DUF3179 domain-containing protein [Spirochaetaceae bacterium]